MVSTATVLIVASVLAIVAGGLLIVFRDQYGRWGGREMSKTFRAFGDEPGDWADKYRGVARFGGAFLIIAGLVGLVLGLLRV